MPSRLDRPTLLLLLIVWLAQSGWAQTPSFHFAREYTVEEMLSQPDKREQFLTRYVAAEKPFFKAVRHPESALSYDGWNLNPETGQPREARQFSAPSKECLDIALLTKAVAGNPLANQLVSADEAAELMRRKIQTYREWYQEKPGYGGFFPWYVTGARIQPTDNWVGRICGLDNGEMLWSLLAAEDALKEAGYQEAAAEVGAWNQHLQSRIVDIFYDPVAGLVRGDPRVNHPERADSTYDTADRATWLAEEHGVHEGIMLVMYVTLYGKGLPEDAQERIWSGTRMIRVEHPYGSTWQGWYGSTHEEWAYLFFPYRELPEYRQLFRIRQAIRTQDAAASKFPGLRASALAPDGSGYWTGSGIEGLNRQKLKNQQMFTPYGAFPVILEDRAVGSAWLLNMLRGPRQQGPMGAGESGTGDGRHASASKTIDVTFTTLLAVMGGLDQELAARMRRDGVYDRFQSILRQEYQESFGSAPLKEPKPLTGPTAPVPDDLLKDYI